MGCCDLGNLLRRVELTTSLQIPDNGGSEIESIDSSNTSVSSSILDYRFENGRTYHRYKDGKYNIPDDEREMDRLDLQHHICLMTLGGRLGLTPPCQAGADVGRVLCFDSLTGSS
ncbi:hypothetical protein BDP81DRAFT_428403 [Colletotrichum phormii]|uniref:Uncharacterized protein n=1 Tax=Colletotrichum phormii TaxID=359342 RepID=A0AAI9ZRF6_9PEZI|nr:uncharacterized protein BDP81DRAFT_428403 [Colletotrichum phormii]KAK1636811.1 hypothetical protein BDP81DRAFT_428403 [Colletotrichum phormii]